MKREDFALLHLLEVKCFPLEQTAFPSTISNKHLIEEKKKTYKNKNY